MKNSISHFYPETKILRILINLIISGLLFTGYNSIVYAGNIHMQKTVDIQCSYSGSKAGADFQDTTVRKTNHNFYKTDSIFSFRSPKGYFPSLLNNFGQQAVSPFKLSAKQWLMTAGAAGITITLLHFDGEIDEWARVQKQKHSWVNKTSPVITNFGGPWGIYSVLATGVISAVCSKEKGVQTALLATQAMITSGVWANIVKVLTGRERPMADYAFSKSEGGAWYGPFAAWDQDLAVRKPISAFDAFPSGHTATAFSIATVFASQYSDHKAVPIIFYSAATLVGISRLTEHEHWASDVFVGGLLGYLCGKQVVNHYNKTHQDNNNLLSSKSRNKAEFSFVQNGNQVGFSLKW